MSLLLKDLLVYPIERYIPPVAKVDDTAEATVEAELREYVVTAPIERALAARGPAAPHSAGQPGGH